MSIELRLIRHALALARHRNFARAAEALHLTQPSLSRSIAALEEQLGVTLFDRGPRGVEPTAFGRLLVERGAALLHDEAELRREVRLLAGVDVGTLAVGVGPYAGTQAAAQAVAQLIARHPRLQVELHSEGADAVVAGVRSGRHDVGVVAQAGFEDDTDLAIEALPEQRLRVACRPGHPLAGKHPDAAEFFAWPLVSAPALGAPLVGVLSGRAIGRVDDESGAFHMAVTVNSFELARTIATQSDALLPGTDAMLAEDIAAGRLVTVDFDLPQMRVTPAFVTLRGRTPTPAAQAFVAAMREAAAPRRAGRSRR